MVEVAVLPSRSGGAGDDNSGSRRAEASAGVDNIVPASDEHPAAYAVDDSADCAGVEDYPSFEDAYSTGTL